MSILWEDPAPIIRKKTKNEQIFEALIANPGQWGRIGTAKNIKAARHRMYMMSAEAKKMGFSKFEFTARQLGNNNGAIYARFAGAGLPDEAYKLHDFIISN